MLKSVRQESVLALLHARGSASITEIAATLGVSPATARRDIMALEQAGALTRTWGGAQVLTDVDDPFQEAVGRNGGAKQRIGAAAAALVKDGDTVILDIGTTVLYTAMALASRQVTVVTASLPVFEHLRGRPNISLTLLGGRWSEPYQCFDGPLVIDALAHQQADLAFLGCSGLSERGRVRDTSYSQAAIKRAVLQAASSSYLLCDADKLPGHGDSSPFDLSPLDGLITDATLSAPLARLCEACSTPVIPA
ncbi:MAG: DeoR/GlpR family DNA-binding transcription regulator [Actinomyces urogenitalis]|uniref:DeoR/GlpR family DNA-binding transcription regulator n=1 Tax=Actinomyces urogenitalis TaxID=103621 RepID=UPI002A84078D|nr:DeoR/GlpR family DNA-binding transcription regulator [Actinomyces urogenitalis]MDY3677636.1 DeoR/GlpR family DNA-binding transcription regulator [Actinomyces urogenitalis]